VIDRAAVMDFRAKRLAGGAAPGTVNKDLRQIRSALSYAVDAGLLRANSPLRWKGLMLPEPEKQVRVVQENEFAKLLEACENPSLRPLLIVAYRQGLRRKELANLRWAAVDLDRQILHVVKDRGGWSTVRVVEKHYTGDVSPVYRAAMDRIAGMKTA
jgi:integrase